MIQPTLDLVIHNEQERGMASPLSPEVVANLKHHIEQQKSSGMNKAKYCREHNVDYEQFQYLSRKMRLADRLEARPVAGDPTRCDFVPLIVEEAIHLPKPDIAPTSFAITHTNGSKLEWSCNWPADQVLEFVTQWGQSR